MIILMTMARKRMVVFLEDDDSDSGEETVLLESIMDETGG